MKASQVIKELASLIDNRGDREVKFETELFSEGCAVKRITYCEACDEFIVTTDTTKVDETH